MDWQRLIELHEHAVVLSLLARGVRLKRARELAHEAFARLFEKHQAGLLPVVQLPGLAIRQAEFLALQQRPRAEVSLEEEPEAFQVADLGATVEVRLAFRQQVAVASRALQTCGPRARQVFDTALEAPDTPQASLAAQVGVSLQRFRQTLCEVRARLRAALREEEEP